ncbi:methionyl-tRNA formyltransferase [candidate division KSB1 bacterium]|nr:methionyl-tRNA formyltransferase [candidate division KSB1 bacterium]
MNVVFMGTPDFAVPSLMKIAASHHITAVVTAPDKPAGRGKRLQSSAIKKAAETLNVPTLQPIRLNDPGFAGTLERFRADVFVVVAFRILPIRVFSIPPMGTINLHASLLPRYRGAAPIQWALINGEKVTGVTTFFIDEQVDTGKILLQEKLRLSDEITAGELHDQLAELGADLLVATLNQLQAGTLEPRRQNGEPCPAPKLTRELGAIDWNLDAFRIHNLIRGLSPVPGAYTHWEAKVLKILRSQPLLSQNEFPAGTIVRADKKGPLLVQTGNGLLEILSLLPEGKKVLSAEEFIRGYKIAAKQKLT